jgi:hypothetical protein
MGEIHEEDEAGEPDTDTARPTRTKARTAVTTIVAREWRKKTFKDQVYVCMGVEPYERLDGTTTKLAVWRSACADCGQLFLVRLPAKARRFDPNRRCPAHRRPGLPVQPRGRP